MTDQETVRAQAAEGERIRKISMWYAMHPRTVSPADWSTITAPKSGPRAKESPLARSAVA